MDKRGGMQISESTLTKMRQALRNLIIRSADAQDPDIEEDPRVAMYETLAGERYCPFVVFNARPSGKVVQFAGYKSRPLVLDLPLQSLSTEEKQRAAALFEKIGVTSPEVGELYDFPTGEPAGFHTSYSLEFGKDVESALKTALEIFSSVFKAGIDFERWLAETSLECLY